MTVPAFVTDLRKHVGTHPLWLTTSNAVVFRLERGHDASQSQVLLVLHKERQAWSLPGGICDPGEHPCATAVRECFEETRIQAIPIRLVAVTVSPQLTYSNGDKSQYTELWYQCAVAMETSHEVVTDHESIEAGWFRLTTLPEPLSPNVRHVIERAASGDVCTLDLPCNTVASRQPEVHPTVVLKDPLSVINPR